MRDNKKKILFVCNLPPPVHGSNVINQLVINNSRLNNKYSCLVFPYRFNDQLSDVGSIHLEKFINYLILVSKLIVTLLRYRPDYVYFVPAVKGLAFLRDYITLTIAKVLYPQVILHIHGQGFKSNTSSFMKYIIYRSFFHKAEIILLSPLLLSDICEFIDLDRVSFVSNGIDCSYDNNKSKCRVARPPRILFLSNLHIAKGPIVLLNASLILRDRGYRFSIMYCGSPSRELPIEDFLNEIRERNLNNIVEYIGPKYGEEKSDILNSSDIFAFPSTDECFPLVILEAMASGLPIVTTNVGAIPEIVEEGKTGFIVPPGDARSLAEKLGTLIEHSGLRAQFGRHGRDKYEEMYTVTHFNMRIFETMDKIICKTDSFAGT